MDRPFYNTKRLQAEDFRRLGVRLQEWRPTIIRQAAARIARGLAQKQLQSPTDQIERELSEVTISTYRVLDPRRRDDSSERISVGRILPLALRAASETRFCNGLPDEQSASTLSTDATELIADELLAKLIVEIDPAGINPAGAESDRATSDPGPLLIPMLQQQTVPLSVGTLPLETAFDPGNHVARRLESDSLLKGHARKRFVGRIRREIHRPMFVASLVALACAATIGVSRFNRIEPRVASSGGVASITRPKTVSQDGTEARLTNVENVPATTSADVPFNDGGVNDGGDLADSDRDVLNGFIEDGVEHVATANAAQNEFDLVRQQASQDAAAEQAVEPMTEQTEQWLQVAAMRAKQVVDVVENAFSSTTTRPNDEFRPDPFGSSQDSMHHEKKVDIADGPPPVPNEEALAQASQRLRQMLPQIVEVVSSSTAPKLINRLSEIQSAAAPGSAEFWVANMVAAKVGWSVRGADKIREGLQTLADVHSISVESLLAESFLQRQPFVETKDAHRTVMRGGFSVAESTLRSQSLEQCQRVIELTKRSAEFLGDEDAMAQLNDYEDALEQMVRLRLKANDIVRWADSSHVNASDAAIAGRYHCLYLRDWAGGLKWLANSKDPRLAVLARAELDLRDGAGDVEGQFGTKSISIQDEWSRLASRWLAIASRNTGRIAESMRLHALALNEKALFTARGSRKLMIQRKIDEIRASLSSFAFDSKQSLASASRIL